MSETGSKRPPVFGRRQVLRSSASAAAIGFASWTVGVRAAFASGLVFEADVFPSPQPISDTYPVVDRYPEQSDPRFSAASGKWGVAFSGGGSRAFACALGQMRGLKAANVLEQIGAISCVSGGSWFGSLFSFAPSAISDETLLGAYVRPADITVSGAKELPDLYLGKTLNGIGLDNIVLSLAAEIINAANGKITYDRIYSRLLNDILLAPYGLNGTDTYFTLDPATRNRIRKTNDIELYVQRPNRPFFIASGTQISQPPGTNSVATTIGVPGQLYRNIEYTSYYVGSSQFVPPASGHEAFGGGYVESFAFDTPAPKAASPTDRISVAAVPSGELPFLLSDAIGSSSAFVGGYIAQYIKGLKADALDILKLVLSEADYEAIKAFIDQDYQMAAFDYWPVLDHQPAKSYAFADGGVLENTGLVPLLRRGYKTILAFVNSDYALGSNDDDCVGGIDAQITQLFGFNAKTTFDNGQNTQIFAKSQLAPLTAELLATKAKSERPIVSGDYPVLPDNPFEIPPYTPHIVWFYNSPIKPWVAKLQPDVAAVLGQTKATDNFENFPNLSTEKQNTYSFDGYDTGIPNPAHLTAEQINLLAHMWAWTVKEYVSANLTVGGA